VLGRNVSELAALLLEIPHVAIVHPIIGYNIAPTASAYNESQSRNPPESNGRKPRQSSGFRLAFARCNRHHIAGIIADRIF
jgi:hypothetical protein